MDRMKEGKNESRKVTNQINSHFNDNKSFFILKYLLSLNISTYQHSLKGS